MKIFACGTDMFIQFGTELMMWYGMGDVCFLIEKLDRCKVDTQLVIVQSKSVAIVIAVDNGI